MGKASLTSHDRGEPVEQEPSPKPNIVDQSLLDSASVKERSEKLRSELNKFVFPVE